jgi:hypothetical protein
VRPHVIICAGYQKTKLCFCVTTQIFVFSCFCMSLKKFCVHLRWIISSLCSYNFCSQFLLAWTMFNIISHSPLILLAILLTSCPYTHIHTYIYITFHKSNICAQQVNMKQVKVCRHLLASTQHSYN